MRRGKWIVPNQEESIVSIIIPVYNMEKYLDECIISIVNQTFQNIEIILIDDGSTDASLDICMKWSKSDSRIQVWHQNNRGVSSARNKGIEMAKGEYLLFVDADDYVDEEYVQSLYEKLDLADMIICGYSKVTDHQSPILLGKEGLLKREELFFHMVCTNIVHMSSWNKIYRKTILRENNIKFHENIAIGEDMIFVVEYLQYCNSYYYINRAIYFYRKNEQSATNSTYSSRKFNEKNISSLESILELENITQNENNEIRNYIGYRIIRSNVRLMWQMILGNKEDKLVFKRIKRNCKRNIMFYIKARAGTRLEKIIGLLLCFFPYLVYLIGRFIINKKILSLNKYIE